MAEKETETTFVIEREDTSEQFRIRLYFIIIHFLPHRRGETRLVRVGECTDSHGTRIDE